MKFETYKFEHVTSTNDIAANLIQEKMIETGCVYAKMQTSGRGTHGKKWISEMGNLFISIFFPLRKNYPSFDEFSIINPVLISNALKNFSTKKISLKWPNDIFINKKKICGVLQEVITFNNKKFLIIGVGINVITSPTIDNKYQATNIFAETKTKPKLDEIINFILSFFENFFSDLNNYSFINYKEKAEFMALN